MILKNALVLNDRFDFEKLDIETENDIIKSVGALSDSQALDCSGKYIVPGLCDVHTHGCVGFDSIGVPDVSTVNKMSLFYAEHGVTTYLPTIGTATHDEMVSSVKCITDAHKKGISGANIGGIHFEGPYFNEKYKGGQNPDKLRLPDIDEFNELYELSDGLVRLISIAPELCGAEDFIKEVSPKAVVAIGHTDADEETARRAIKCGATQLTHTFNAMRPIHHRSPNAIGAALDSGLYCEFICDGFHINKTIIRIMYKLLGDEKMMFISDSLPAAGVSDGDYEFSGLAYFVRNGQARLADGTIAGSTVTLFDCVKNAMDFGIPAESAFKMASLIPAKACRIDDVCGSITVGKRADLLILNDNFELEKVIVRGRFLK